MSGTFEQPRRIVLDKIASSTVLAQIPVRVDLSTDIPARAGTIVAGRILNAKSVYNTLEDVHGRMRKLMPGDHVAGALGHRNALHGYVGHVPQSVKVGDVLNVLNLGGVIGVATSQNPDVGPPFQLEVLGSVLTYPKFGERQPRPAVVEQSEELKNPALPANLPPILLIAGTTMNAGKTTAICEILRHFKRMGKNVAAAKCTGVSLLKDTLEMRDFGASRIMSFMDLGVITTSPSEGPSIVRAIIRTLAADKPDAILLELGDGILGTYGVPEIFKDEGIRDAITALVMCGTDPVAAWGGVYLMKNRFGVTPVAISGPATDNAGGTGAAEREFGVPGINARLQGELLAKTVLAALEKGK